MSQPDDPGRQDESGSRSVPDPDGQAPTTSPWSRPGAADESSAPAWQPTTPTESETRDQGPQAPEQGTRSPEQSWQAPEQPWQPADQSQPPDQAPPPAQPQYPAQAQQPYPEQPGQAPHPAQAQQAYPQQPGPQQAYPQQPFASPQGDQGQPQWQPVPQQGPQGGTPYPPMSSQPVPYPPPARLRSDYAHWGRRVGANVIDYIPGYIVSIVFLAWYIQFLGAMIMSLQQGESYAPDLSSLSVWMIVICVLSLGSLGWTIYNRWITGGRTGQSLGKRITKIKLISEQTGQPIGAGYAFLRDLVHYLDGIAYVGYLWPLWDEKRQTFSDKLMQTIVIDQPDQQS